MAREAGFPAALVLAALLPACLLRAGSGTTLDWLGGTQPWDSTPMEEVNAEAWGGGPGARSEAGAGAQWGILDTLQASGLWLCPASGGDPTGDLDLRLRQTDSPRRGPALSAYVRAPFSGGALREWAGVGAEMDPWQSALALNAEAAWGGRWRVRLAGWSPYLLPTLRVGMEASWLDAAAEAYTPQILINAPGDLSLQAGVRLGQGPALWTACLSYELFPGP